MSRPLGSPVLPCLVLLGSSGGAPNTNMKELTTRQYINRVRQQLQIDTDPRFPVRIRQATLPKDEFGSCDLVDTPRGTEFLILLQKGMSHDMILFVLVHEWAHTLAWSLDLDTKDHGPAWGRAYSKCWRAVAGGN